MRQIERIVVALDLSVYSQGILEYALTVARRTSSELVLVNVINRRNLEAAKQAFNAEHPGGFSMDKFVGDDVRRRKRQLMEMMAECGAETDPCRIDIRTGVPFEEILNAVEAEVVDLLVMGRTGRTNLPGFLFGSTAEKLFRHSPVPVLSVRVKPLS
ncbi:MAG: universal stress protein [Desulfobacterium sp.]|nr:universal stress protein [Desulfobacterium sp.]